jgi:predicted metal-binding protein
MRQFFKRKSLIQNWLVTASRVSSPYGSDEGANLLNFLGGVMEQHNLGDLFSGGYNSFLFCVVFVTVPAPLPIPSNAFTALMSSSARRKERQYLTVGDFSQGRHGPLFFIEHLCEYLKSQDIAVIEASKSDLVRVFTGIATVLWNLDQHWLTISSRAPPTTRTGLAWIYHHGLLSADRALHHTSEEVKKRRGRVNISATELNENCNKLSSLLGPFPMHLESHCSLRNGLEAVVAAGTSYVDYLREQAVRNERKGQLLPLSLRHENNRFRELPVLMGPLSATVVDIATCVPMDPYEPVCISELPTVAQLDRKTRWDLLHDLALPFPACLFEHSFLGRLPNSVHVWRIIDGAPDKEKQSQNVVDRLIIPFLTERASRQFSKNFTNVARSLKITGLPSQLKKLLHETMEVVPEEYSAGLEERLDWLLQLDDVQLRGEFTIDERRGVSTAKLEPFWKLVEELLALHGTRGVNPDNRRHEKSASMMDGIDEARVAGSLRNFYEQCVELAYSREICVPSLEWFRFAFIDTSGRKSRHFGRIQVSLRSTRKVERQANINAHYIAAIWRDLSQFLIEGHAQDRALLWSLDDKAKIHVGENVAKVAVQTASRRVVVHAGEEPRAADHDLGGTKVEVSVTLRVAPPRDMTGSMRRGSVRISLRPAVTKPSSPARHWAQLLVSRRLPECGDRDVETVFTDSGGDHNVAFAKVVGNMFMYFMCVMEEFGAVCVMAAGTAGGQSYTNFVERVMSTVNYGVYGMVLKRSTAPRGFEELFAGKTTKELRKLFAEPPLEHCEEVYNQSMRQPINMLRASMESLSYTGEPVVVVTREEEQCAEAFIEQWKARFRAAFDLNLETLTNKDLAGCDAWQKFENSHMERTANLVRFFRCGKEEQCQFCKHGKRLTTDQLKHWFSDDKHDVRKPWPFPEEDPLNKGHYRPISEALKLDLQRAVFAPPSELRQRELMAPLSEVERPIYKSAQVQGYITCTSCSRPRVIYSSHQLRSNEQEDLLEDLDGHDFKCGFEDVRLWTRHLERTVRSGSNKQAKVPVIAFTHPGLHCSVMVEPHFYKFVFGSKLQRASTITVGAVGTDRIQAYSRCVYCGLGVDGVDLKANKQPEALPMCAACVRKELPAVGSKGKLVIAREAEKEK